MDGKALERLWHAIDFTEKLFKQNNTPEDWSDNIIKGSEKLKTPLEYGNYVNWLTNSNDFQVKHEIEFASVDDDILEKHEYPEGIEEIIHKNGNDYIIHVRNNHFGEPSQDDEKNPE